MNSIQSPNPHGTPLLRVLALLAFALLIAILSSLLTFYFLQSQSQTEPPSSSATPTVTGVACTMEAKICPDGTGVGRTGPNCEFAPCPTGKDVDNP